MINKEELKISNESYTNKDFESIYPEVVSLIKKISPKWDPSLSNESDPGNVLIKAMAFLADKVNYNADKNMLENFLLSATQDTSARNLFEMNGYFPKYYQSAITSVKFKYNGSKLSAGQSITFPAMKTVISDTDNTVSFSLMKPLTIYQSKVATDAVPAIQGTFKTLSVGGDETIKLSDLDDNNKIYLPETMIAQNGVFVFDSESFSDGMSSTDDSWERVDNLNLVEPGHGKHFKFGFDSNKGLPFVEFPDNIADMIGSGLIIKYVITAGSAGNVSAQYLTKLVSPLEVEISNGDGSVLNFDNSEEAASDETDAGDLTVYNISATVGGANPESIDDAYNSYKKTVGTFDTLVTCRDYANAIYNAQDSTSYPYVSNAQVADRRTDINYGNSIVTYSSLGKEVVMDTDSEAITPFTLCLYPLKPIHNIYDVSSYVDSFKPLNGDSLKYLEKELEGLKTLSHTYQKLSNDDIYLIKNYYKLNVRLTTTYKVNSVEQMDIRNNVCKALYENFNARKVDYGYEIPYDTLYKVIKESDARIKNVAMDDPDIDTRICFKDGDEISLMDTSTIGGESVREHYIKILAKNILAGRMPLFDYDTEFTYDFGQSPVTAGTQHITQAKVTELKSVTTEFNLPVADHTSSGTFEYALNDNEIIQCIAPSMQSSLTYPAYVNFRYEGTNNIPADSEHKMQGTEVLYINYTNSDKQVMNIIYTPTSIIRNGKTEVKDAVYIKSNFEIKPTANSYESGNRTVTDKTIGGVKMMFNTLAADEQIEEREIVSRVIDDTELYCYWSVNRADNKLFTDEDAVHEDPSDPTSNIKYYERLLGDNEYFAYCDASLTDIVIRGSGTVLRWMSTRTLTSDDTYWACQKQGIDGLVENGISAFSDFNWQSKSFKNENLEIHVMQILTLGSGDSIKISNCTLTGNLTNGWKKVSNSSRIEYSISGGSYEPLAGFDIEYLSWSIRTRLDLSCGPSVGQRVKATHKLTFEDKYGSPYVVEPYDDVEPLVSLSQYVSLSGGKDIDLTVTEISADGVGEPECVLSMFAYDYSQPEYDVKESGETVSRALEKTGGYYVIPCSKLAYDVSGEADISLPLLGDSSSQDRILIMFHTSKEEGSLYTITVDAGTSPHAVREFNGPSGFVEEVTLCAPADDDTIHIIEVSQSHSGPLTVHVTYTGSLDDIKGCTLTIGGISVVKTRALPLESGQSTPDVLCASERFGLSEAEEEKLFEDISELDTHGLFFYNAPIDKGSAIDIDEPGKPEFFWDRNNLFNRFTLGEIDFSDDSGTSISVVKSSQL